MMLASVIVLFVLYSRALSRFASLKEILDDEWGTFKLKYDKKYDGMEEYSKRNTWEQNREHVREHNARYGRGEVTYFLAINEFADITQKEFSKRVLYTIEQSPSDNYVMFTGPSNVGKLPDSVDWVKKGYVTRVKSQLHCGSCWSFSVTGALEGQYFRKTKRLVSFSEKQLVDCSREYGTGGCAGGWMGDAYRYIKDYGIEREEDYSYTAAEGPCRYNASKVVTKIAWFARIESHNEQSLEIAVATQGPISVAIDAVGLQPLFGGGIYDDRNCSTTYATHAVLVVGYGVERGNKYWLVKNSWGTGWGERGYFKLAKFKNNLCGIATRATYPII